MPRSKRNAGGNIPFPSGIFVLKFPTFQHKIQQFLPRYNQLILNIAQFEKKLPYSYSISTLQKDMPNPQTWQNSMDEAAVSTKRGPLSSSFWKTYFLHFSTKKSGFRCPKTSRPGVWNQSEVQARIHLYFLESNKRQQRVLLAFQSR